MDDKIAERLSRFADAVNFKGFSSTKEVLKFKAVAGMSESEVEKAYLEGLSIAELNENLTEYASKKPKQIADLYSDIVEAYRNK